MVQIKDCQTAAKEGLIDFLLEEYECNHFTESQKNVIHRYLQNFVNQSSYKELEQIFVQLLQVIGEFSS